MRYCNRHRLLNAVSASGRVMACGSRLVVPNWACSRRLGDPAKIRAAETRKQKHDRRDARLILDLLLRDRFPAIWMPSTEQRDLRTLLRDRHQWVKMRSRLQPTLQAIALNHALRKGSALWSQAGQTALQVLPLAPYTSQRRAELLSLYLQLQKRIQTLDQEVADQCQM
jgi:transposase